jgi:hypothetical protein
MWKELIAAAIFSYVIHKYLYQEHGINTPQRICKSYKKFLLQKKHLSMLILS